MNTPAPRRERPRSENYKGQVPFGFDYSGDALVENLKEQKALRLIREMRESSRTLRAIAGELNGRRIPTKNGGIWQANTVKKILER